MGENIAYVRVSSTDQNMDRQLELLSKYNIKTYYTEKISGKDTNRPQLQDMLKYIRKGDTLYVESLSRLARNQKDLFNIIDVLEKKEVEFVSVKENIDLGSAMGKLMFSFLAMMSEFERDLIKERQAEGIKIAKEKGKFKGKNYKKINEDEFKEIIKKWEAKEITAVQAYTELDITKSKFYRRYKRFKESGKIN